MAVDQPADHGVQQQHEDCAQGADEEEGLAAVGKLIAEEGADIADEVQEKQRRQTHGGVLLRASQVLQNVDKYLVGSLARREASDAHQRRHLADGNVQSRASHEGRDCRQRDEVDDPATPNQADEEDDGPSDNGERRGDDVSRDLGVGLLELDEEVPNECGHDSDGLRVSREEVEASWGLTPMVMSFDVAKNQYTRRPMKDEYKPNCGGRLASSA